MSFDRGFDEDVRSIAGKTPAVSIGPDSREEVCDTRRKIRFYPRGWCIPVVGCTRPGSSTGTYQRSRHNSARGHRRQRIGHTDGTRNGIPRGTRDSVRLATRSMDFQKPLTNICARSLAELLYTRYSTLPRTNRDRPFFPPLMRPILRIADLTNDAPVALVFFSLLFRTVFARCLRNVPTIRILTSNE